jgi:hypothetical protein
MVTIAWLLTELVGGVFGGNEASGTHLTPNILTSNPDAERPRAVIEDVAWIAGHWQGEVLGGLAEEIWAPPNGGAMMGMFRLVSEDQVKFYEILTIAEDNGGLVLKLKHFNRDLTGWEEKDEVVAFPLVQLGKGEAHFDGLTFRGGGDALTVYVAQRLKDGSVKELVFPYERMGER